MFLNQKRGGMKALSSHEVFLFEGFRLDRRSLSRRDKYGAEAPVEIGSRALDVLGVLLQRPGDLVSRNEIMATAWAGTAVEDNNLTIQIASLPVCSIGTTRRAAASRPFLGEAIGLSRR